MAIGTSGMGIVLGVLGFSANMPQTPGVLWGINLPCRGRTKKFSTSVPPYSTYRQLRAWPGPRNRGRMYWAR